MKTHVIQEYWRFFPPLAFSFAAIKKLVEVPQAKPACAEW